MMQLERARDKRYLHRASPGRVRTLLTFELRTSGEPKVRPTCTDLATEAALRDRMPSDALPPGVQSGQCHPAGRELGPLPLGQRRFRTLQQARI